MPPAPPILLLKTKSSPHDGYDDYFSRNGYTPTFIPVLEHRFHRQNLAHVRDLFVSGAFAADSEDADGESGITAPENNKGKKYGGMIFTSQRAVEGFARMIEEDGCMSAIHPFPQRDRDIEKQLPHLHLNLNLNFNLNLNLNQTNTLRFQQYQSIPPPKSPSTPSAQPQPPPSQSSATPTCLEQGSTAPSPGTARTSRI